jgi:hypothetical protein
MSLRSRLKRLEDTIPVPAEGPCPRPYLSALIVIDSGAPVPSVPSDLPSRPTCGGAHVVIEELIVMGLRRNAARG